MIRCWETYLKEMAIAIWFFLVKISHLTSMLSPANLYCSIIFMSTEKLVPMVITGPWEPMQLITSKKTGQPAMEEEEENIQVKVQWKLDRKSTRLNSSHANI